MYRLSPRVVFPIALAVLVSFAPRGVAAQGVRSAVRLTLATPGTPPLAHIKVTAMAFRRDGTVVAGGRYLAPPFSNLVAPPYSVAGSVVLISHDYGVTWQDVRVSTTKPRAIQQGGTAPWRDHTRWPLDFLALDIAFDPNNPRVIYAAGCSTTGETCSNIDQGHGLLRSTDGGRTWSDALIWRESKPSTYPTAATVTTNIIKTPRLFADLRYISQRPAKVFSVVVDGRHRGRVYACGDGTGVLRSDDGGHTWRYVPQPNKTLMGCEIALDPANPRTLYSTDAQGILYRSMDEGLHWNQRSALGQQGTNPNVEGMADLVFVERRLCVTVPMGIYGSADGGETWRRLEPPVSSKGYLIRTIRGVTGWLTPGSIGSLGPGGLYEAQDGNSEHWQLAVLTDNYGPPHYGALDFRYALDRVQTRVWENPFRRTVFTAGTIGGLYRWSGAL